MDLRIWKERKEKKKMNLIANTSSKRILKRRVFSIKKTMTVKLKSIWRGLKRKKCRREN